MTYTQLLRKLEKLGIYQVGRIAAGGYDQVLIGRPAEAIYPYPFTSYAIILDEGMDSVIDEEIVDAILRRFSKTRQELDPPM